MYSVLVGAVIAIDFTELVKFTCKLAVKSCPFVKLSASASVYVTVKFWLWTVVALYPVTIESSNVCGACAPAFAYVTVYCTLLAVNKLDNVSLYLPLIVDGFIVIPVT